MTPFAADAHQGKGRKIIPGKDDEILGAQSDHPGPLIKVAGGLFDADDVRQLGQSGHGIGEQVQAGAPGHVIDDNGDFGGLGDDFIMLK